MPVPLATLLLPVAAMTAAPSPPPACAVRSPVVPAARYGRDFQRLDRPPAATLYLTVYREVDRCPAPMIVRTRLGSGARP